MNREVPVQDQDRPRDLIILGAAGAWVLAAAENAEESGWRVRGLVNNLSPEEVHLRDCPYPVYQLRELPRELRSLPAFCCLATPEYRRRLIAEAIVCGIQNFIRLIHPSASLGEGVYVGTMAGVATRAQLGPHVHAYHQAFVGHDSQVEDFVSIASGATIGSTCRVHEGAYIGIGAVVIPRVTVGRNAVVAAGAVVTQDVPPHTLVAGVPAVVKKEGIAGYRGGGEGLSSGYHRLTIGGQREPKTTDTKECCLKGHPDLGGSRSLGPWGGRRGRGERLESSCSGE